MPVISIAPSVTALTFSISIHGVKHYVWWHNLPHAKRLSTFP